MNGSTKDFGQPISPVSSPTIAISYRRVDSAPIAGRIRERLTQRFGADAIFIDIYDIPLGANFFEHIQDVWAHAKVLLALIGSRWIRCREQEWSTLLVRYLVLPIVVLLICHYLIVHALDIDIGWLRAIVFMIPIPFGAFFFWETRKRFLECVVLAAALGILATAAMTISTSLRYPQSILPSSGLEWLENIEFVIIVAIGFLIGNTGARLPKVTSWLYEHEDWVFIEVETALKRDIPIIPVLLDGAIMPSPRDLPTSIREITYRAAIQLNSGADFDVHMQRLISGIEKIIDKELQGSAGQSI
jgi:TIR domain